MPLNSFSALSQIHQVVIFPGISLVDSIAPIQDQRFAIQRVILAAIKGLEPQARRVSAFLHSRGIETQSVDVPPENSTKASIEFLCSVFCTLDPSSTVINASGLDPYWAVCVYRAAQRHNLGMFSIHPDSDALFWLNTPAEFDWPEFNIMDRLSLSGYFRLNGYQLQEAKYTLNRRDPRIEKAAAQFAEMALKKPSQVHALNRLIAKMAPDNPLCTHLPYEGSATQLQWLADAGILTITDSGHLLFSDAENRAFFAGGWLEVHVFAELAALVQELGIQDAATGVKVVSESEVGSEFDLAVLYNNQLYLAECKARAPAGKANGIGMETLFKIDSLVDHNYLNADGLIVSLSAPTHVERSRAALQDIDIISAADLHQLRSRLKTWLQG